MESLFVLLVLAALAVPVLLIVALVSISGLKHRVASLENDVSRLRVAQAVAAEAASTRKEPEPAAVREAAPAAPQSPPTTPVPPVSEPQVTTPAPAPGPAAPPPPVPPPLPRPAPRSEPAPPNVFEVAIRAAQQWFTTGNVPVKIGMLVLLAGVAALLKYANDQGWLQMPIELRLAGVAVFALAGLIFGWRQRRRRRQRAFALTLQGGAIGILLLTIFAAFKLYSLMDAGVAFGLSVLMVGGLGVLAVAQNARVLAVLGILSGFLAPIWLSTGSGNHVALFSYYAILNAAILAIAWWRPWRVLNLLGFVFTWGIGTVWGVLQYDPEKFVSTEPFLLLFFAFYLLIPILYARRRPAGKRDLIDGCLLFGTPLIAFLLQAGLLEGARMPLAFCALGLAALYAVLAWLLIRRESYTLLGQSYALLAAGFATLAVPLALSARATASVFALEGAGVLWLGLKQKRLLPQLMGAGLQLAAALAFFVGVDQTSEIDRAVINSGFMSALLIALAGLASAWACRQSNADRSQDKTSMSAVYYLWGLLWWLGDVLVEIVRFVDARDQFDAILVLAAVTGWLAAEVHRRRPAPLLLLTTLAGFLAALPLAVMQSMAHADMSGALGHPFEGYGIWAWLAFAVFGIRSLLCLREARDGFAGWAQFLWWLVWPLALSLLCSWLATWFALSQGWQLALVALPWLAIAAVSVFRWAWLAWPLGDGFAAQRTPLQHVYFIILALGWLFMLFQPASAAPLPWVPLLNPSELMQLAILLLSARWLREEAAPWRTQFLFGAGFVWITAVVLRAAHHWGGIAWDAGMLSTSLAQTCLTVTWSVLGVLGWILGSRRGRRSLWLASAVLMAVVLAKLILIDRTHLGNLLGIGSFIAYGLLCTVVGFFAPAPPRAPQMEQERAA